MKNDSNVIERKKILRGLRFAIMLSLLISALIIIFTIDKDSLSRFIQKINPGYIALLFLIIFMHWVVAGLRLKLLVNTIGDNISLKDSIIVFLAGAFVSNVTPFATGGGPFQVYFLHKNGVNIGKSSTVIVIQFVLRLFFFGIITPIFLLFFNWAISPGVMPVYIFYLAFGMGIFFSVILIILILVPQVTDHLIDRILQVRRIHNLIHKSYKAKRWLVKAKKELLEFRTSLNILSKYKWRLLMAGILTAIFWSLLFMIMPVVLIGLGLKPHFFESFVMQTIFYLVIPYMPTPGASGIAEVSYASLFVSFIPRNFIGLVTFAWRLFSFYLVLLVGGYFALKEIGNRSKANDRD